MFSTACAWLFASLALVSSSSHQVRTLEPPPLPQSKRPSFVILLCDDLGYGDLGCFGHPTIRTPNIDRLAAQGMKLTSCYAGMPVCSPSRAALMTGRVCQREEIHDWIPADTGIQLKRSAVTVAGLLKGAGYATFMAGKWHLNSKLDGTETTPGDHGFDHWLATQNNAGPSHLNPTNFVRNGARVGATTGHSSQVITDEAIRWLDESKPDRPFFAYLPFHAPHEPVAASAKFMQLYPGLETDQAAYFATVSETDEAIGRFLGALDSSKRSEETLVFFSSDNGPETLNRYRTANRSHGSPGVLRGMKLHLYEGGIRVPGILRWPGVLKAGSTSDEPVSFVDLLPTLCELSGAKPPTDRPLDGVSFLPLTRGKPVARKHPLYWQYDKALGPMKFALRKGDWKLLADAELSQLELYHLKTDSREAHDLSANRPDLVQTMRVELKRIRREVAVKTLRAEEARRTQ